MMLRASDYVVVAASETDFRKQELGSTLRRYANASPSVLILNGGVIAAESCEPMAAMGCLSGVFGFRISRSGREPSVFALATPRDEKLPGAVADPEGVLQIQNCSVRHLNLRGKMGSKKELEAALKFCTDQGVVIDENHQQRMLLRCPAERYSHLKRNFLPVPPVIRPSLVQLRAPLHEFQKSNSPWATVVMGNQAQTSWARASSYEYAYGAGSGAGLGSACDDRAGRNEGCDSGVNSGGKGSEDQPEAGYFDAFENCFCDVILGEDLLDAMMAMAVDMVEEAAGKGS